MKHWHIGVGVCFVAAGGAVGYWYWRENQRKTADQLRAIRTPLAIGASTAADSTSSSALAAGIPVGQTGITATSPSPGTSLSSGSVFRELTQVTSESSVLPAITAGILEEAASTKQLLTRPPAEGAQTQNTTSTYGAISTPIATDTK